MMQRDDGLRRLLHRGMYVDYGHTYSKNMDQPVRLPILHVVS